MEALLVVVGPQPIELVLQLENGGGSGLRGEEPFQSLVEPFGLSLGLRMTGRSVLLCHAEQRQEVFEAVASAAEPGSVNPAVVDEG